MNAGPGIDALISEWLDQEAVRRAPDRVLEAVSRSVDRTPQRPRAAYLLEPYMTFARSAAAIFVVAVVAFAGVLIGRSTAPTGSPNASPVSSPAVIGSAEPSVETVTFQAYAEARDAICDAAVQAAAPLKARFLGVFDGTLTPEQRADWSAALDDNVELIENLVTDLGALTPPAELAAEHAADVASFEALNTMVATVAAYLRDGRDAQAEGVDHATDAIAERISKWEAGNALHHCP